MMSNPELVKMASESMKNLRPEDLKHAAEQLKHTRPEEMAEIGEKMANASPEEIVYMRARMDAQVAYEINAAQMLKKQGNELHSQGRYGDALQKYSLAKKNLKDVPASKGRRLLCACSLNLMSCYLKSGQYEECITEGAEVLAHDEKTVEALYQRGQAYKALGQLENAVSDLTKAHEVSPDDETVADVLRDAKEKLVKEGGAQTSRGVIIEEITKEEPTELSRSNESSAEVSVPKLSETSGRSQSQPDIPSGPPSASTEYLQALKDDPESIRSFQNFISRTDPETLAALNNGNTEGMSPEMVKTATDVIGKMSPEELQRMVQLVSSVQGGNPFSGRGNGNSFVPGSIPSKVSPDILKMATEMMSKMSSEDFQQMFNMASSLKGTDVVSSSAAVNSNGYRSHNQSRSQETQNNIKVNDIHADRTTTSQGFSSSTVSSQSSLTGLSGDLQGQMRNQMNDPAMRQCCVVEGKKMGDLDSQKIRNICILAHVDHGKTTLADHLIASYGGGVLHPKQAGRLRYMDYLDEEQRRAITMKSSSIALQYKDHSINLIDSPGHMDFCSEVSTAARLSDGALILVDAVEGVHIQTHAVLRQAWIEKLTPCLVLNKIDRLICELRLSPMEAYTRLQRIVHEVNGIVSAYKSEKYLSDVDALLSAPTSDLDDGDYEFIEDDEEDTFQPQKGNVVFGCALDGWGFSISNFAEFYATKIGASSVNLQKALWGPYYLNKEKKIQKKGINAGAKVRPLFVQFVLEILWQVYQAALEQDGDRGILEKVIKSFNLSVPPRELQNKDPKAVLQAVMSRWLPMSDAILSMVVKHIPDPIAAQSFRISRLLPKREILDIAGGTDVLAEAERVRKSVEACDCSPGAPCVAFVSKMFAIPSKMLPRGEVLSSSNDDIGESEECFLAFARVFSGAMHSGQRVFVLSALYDPLKPELTQKHVQEAELQSLYLMMGQGLKPVTSAKAGNVVAIRGLGQNILKSATLSSTKNCWPFSSMIFQVSPTLKVAIEPSDPVDMGALMKGLRLLNRADPFVEVNVSARGEHVLAAAGEVHLERCIKDLKERFAKISLEVSPPLVSFRETIDGETNNPLENLKLLSSNSEFIEKVTPNGRCHLRVQVIKLPTALTKLLDESSDLLGDIIGGKSGQACKSLERLRGSIVEDDDPIEALKKRMMDAVESDYSFGNSEADRDRAEKCRKLWQNFFNRMWALGPRQVGPNILLAPDSKGKSEDGSVLVRGSPYVSERLGFLDVSGHNGTLTDTSLHRDQSLLREAESLESSVLSGFQLATAAGPLCDEPMWGLAFVVEASISPLVEQPNETDTSVQQAEQYGIAGQVMTAVKDACRAALLQRKPRIVEAMYFCELNTPTEHLGSMYAVLARRRAQVVKEEMQEGSPLFAVHAYVPVAESFGFADELRRWTSGASSALLLLSHWEALEEDPFFVPKTEDEREEFGDGSSMPRNTARKLIDAVRRQKGLPVEEKVVQHATRQRTLARKV